MATTSNRRATGDVLAALLGTLEVVLLPDGKWGSSLPNLARAFDRVEIFDSEQLVEAFRYLLVTEQKVCVVVPMDERFEVVIEKRKLIVRRELPIALLISDRVLGSRKDALLGNADTPGAFNLVELALPIVTGILLPNEAGLGAVVLEPASSSVMSVKDSESDLPSRVCVGLELHARGGYLQADMPLGPVF